ncbi:MAG: filamentous hemagglutinin N-terminal domain-containing protein [Planctomycetota bacterium]
MNKATSIAALVAFAGTAASSPQDAKVVRGSASVHTNGSLTTIRAADKTILEYSAFDIAAGDTVRFIQPNANARVLNRVTGSTASTIDGSLLSNGRVYLVNPNGVFLGGRAIVSTSGFVAAAAHLSNADFLAGRDRFTGIDGDVINRGRIDAGEVLLVGQGVANLGAITAPQGTVALVAGDEVYLKPGDGGPLLQLREPSEATPPKARPGLGSGDMYSVAAWNAGDIRAGSVTLAAAGGTVEVSGRIEARSNGQGGSVRLGTSPGATAMTSTVRVTPDADIRADGGARGDGGSIELWSSGSTDVQGILSARGGARTGDGGFIETSSTGSVYADAAIDVSAPSKTGKGGRWLLDPVDVIITTRELALDKAGPRPNDTTQPVVSIVLVDRVLDTLAGGDVEITSAFSRGAGSGSVTLDVEDPTVAGIETVEYTLGEPRTLTFSAQGDIVLVSPLAPSLGSAPLDLNLQADQSFDVDPDPMPGVGSVRVLADVDLAGGTLSAIGAAFESVDASITAASVDIDVDGVASLGGDLTTTEGVRIAGPTLLTNDVTLDAGSGSTVLLGDVSAESDLGPVLRFLWEGTASIDDLTGTPTVRTPVVLGGSIGPSEPTAPSRVVFGEDLAPGDLAPLNASVVFTNAEPAANGLFDRSDVDLGSAFTIRASDEVSFGAGRKALAFGSLEIEAASVIVGDVVTTGDLTLRGIGPNGQVAFNARPPSQVATPGAESGAAFINDEGVDIVVGGLLTIESPSGTAPTFGSGLPVRLVASNPGPSPAGEIEELAQPIDETLFEGVGSSTTGQLFPLDLAAAEFVAPPPDPEPDPDPDPEPDPDPNPDPDPDPDPEPDPDPDPDPEPDPTPDPGPEPGPGPSPSPTPDGDELDPAEARSVIERSDANDTPDQPARVLSDSDALALLGIELVTSDDVIGLGGSVVLVDAGATDTAEEDADGTYRVSTQRVSRAAAEGVASRFRELLALDADESNALVAEDIPDLLDRYDAQTDGDVAAYLRGYGTPAALTTADLIDALRSLELTAAERQITFSRLGEVLGGNAASVLLAL